MVDYENERLVFPPQVYATNLRPDIIIWSPQSKKVILGELTCPVEENIKQAQKVKKSRYTPLCDSIHERNEGWSVTLLTLEVGARGFVGTSLRSFLNRLGMSARKIRQVINDAANVASRCSYSIYLARETLGGIRSSRS